MIEQIKAALYVRLSQEDRNKLHPEDNSESINNQIMLLKSRCEKEGWIIYDIYNDDDFSGSDRQRPEFNRMIEDARLHKFDVLLCKTQSRFCRDLELVEHYLNYMFPVWNIRFLSIIDNADTSNRQNRKARQINGLIDQWYLEDISENVKAVLSAKRKKGEWVGSQAPYGYAKSPEDKHKLIIDEPAAKIVRYIYRLYINGLGYASIVRRLNDEQIPPPAKYKNLKEVSSHKKTATRGLWCYYTIQKILSSQVYIGNTVQGKSEKLSYKGEERRYKPQSEWDIVENTHDAIVSYDTWHKAQIIRSTRSTPYKQDMKNTVFSRMCKCVYCGATLNKHTYHNSPMLECPTKHIKTGICPGCVITVKRLEEIVIDEIKDHCQRLMDVSAVKSKIDSNVEINNRRQEILKSIESAIKKQKLLKNRLTSLYMDKADGIISINDYYQFKNAIDADSVEIDTTIKLLESKLLSIDDKIKALESNHTIVTQYSNIEKLTHNELMFLVDYIEVGGTRDNRIVRIHWKF